MTLDHLALSVNGGWSAFGPWSVCSKKCDGGQQTRARSCSNPPPWNGGTQCVGTSQETENCNLNRCQGKMDTPQGIFANRCMHVCCYAKGNKSQAHPTEAYRNKQQTTGHYT